MASQAYNPPVGLVRPENDPEARPRACIYDPHLDPQLQWAGKAEHASFEVPTVSLHVHERIDPKSILAAVLVRPADAGSAPAGTSYPCRRAPRIARTRSSGTSPGSSSLAQHCLPRRTVSW